MRATILVIGGTGMLGQPVPFGVEVHVGNVHDVDGN